MGDKYSKHTLSELTVEYFEFEKKINDLNTEKSLLDEKVNSLYNERCDVYMKIKAKQEEEEKIRKQNYIKYGFKADLNDTIQLNRDYGLTLSDLKNSYVSLKILESTLNRGQKSSCV